MRQFLSRPRFDDERGFTLPELLVAMGVGMIVLLAAFTVLDRTFAASGQIADRSDALQRGRQVMENMTQRLRSQVCVGAKVPMVAGNDTSVTFYSDLSDGSQPIRQRTFTYTPATDNITESVVTGAGTYPNLTFTGAATTKTLLTKAEQILDGTPPTILRPVFRYYGYKVGGAPGELEALGSPLSAANLKRVAAIKIGFRSFADRAISKDENSTVLEDDVYVRVAVPTQNQGAAQCV